RSLPPPLPADSDDDDGGDARRAAARAWHRHGLGNAAAARHCDHRRTDGQSGPDGLHDAGRVSVLRSAAALARTRPTERRPTGAATRRGVTRHLTALALAIVAAGCMVGPKYKRPPIAGTPAFKEPPPAGWKEAEPNEGILRGRWWEIYNDPHLNELASKVELSNQNVIAAMARYRE